MTILIIIICIIAVCLAAVLAVLLVPVRYSADIRGENTDMRISLSAGWLSRLLSFDILYEDRKIDYSLKFLSFKLKAGKNDNLVESIRVRGNDTESSNENGIVTLYNKIRSAVDKAGSIKKILDTRSGRRTTGFLKKQLFDLLNIIRPHTIRGRVEYGFEDAASTAIVYGVAANVANIISDDELALIPDFTEKRIDVDVIAQGKFKAVPVARIIFGTVSDEGTQKMFSAIRRIING